MVKVLYVATLCYMLKTLKVCD